MLRDSQSEGRHGKRSATITPRKAASAEGDLKESSDWKHRFERQGPKKADQIKAVTYGWAARQFLPTPRSTLSGTERPSDVATASISLFTRRVARSRSFSGTSKINS